MNIELASYVVGGSGFTSAGLGNQFDTKKKRVNSVYSHSASYKKSKNPKVGVSVVDLSAGPLGLANIGDVNGRFSKSWGSKMENKASSMGSLSDLENMKNTVTEETSYADLNNSVVDGIEDNITPKKTCTHIYVLSQPPKAPSFNVLSNNKNIVALLPSKFKDFNQLLSIKLCVLEKRNFKPVKSFALDIELSAVPGKMNSNKLIAIKKIFYQVDGFGRASTSSKFSEIIRSSFTSELSLNKAKELAVCEKILINNDVRKLGICSNQEIIVKEIPVNLSRSAVESVFAKFGKIVSIKMQLIGLWQKALVEFELSEVASLIASKWSVLIRKNSVQVALAVEDKQSWIFRNQHRVLFYTLPVGTTVHDLSGLLDSYGGKICFIGCNPSSYVCNRCAVVCFADEELKLAAIGFNPVFKSVVTDQDRVCLAGIYKKKQAPIACLVSFGGRTWAQVAGGLFSHVAPLVFFGAGPFLVAETSLFASVSLGDYDMYGCLASLECSLKLLADQVSGILEKLGSINLVSLANTSDASFLAVPVSVVLGLNLDMVLDGVSVIPNPFLPVISDTAPVINPSSSKVLTTKISGLESKMVALKVLVESVLEKLDCLCSDLGLSAIAMCNVRGMNNPMKQDNIIHWHKETNNLISIVTKTKLKGKIRPWIMNKFDGVQVFTSGLDSGHVSFGIVIVMDIFLVRHVCKVSEAGEINFLIAKTVNKSSFIVLGGNFNEDSLCKSVSFKRCLDLGLVNSLSDSSVVKSPTWKNSRDVKKTIDFVLVLSNLVNAVVNHNVVNVSKHFNIDHWAVFVSVGLAKVRKSYCSSKLLESRCTEEVCIKAAINKRIKSFESDKSYTIRSVLERPFHKIVLDHLVVGNKLVLEPILVKSRVDEIMEGWTRKHRVMPDISNKWSCQHQPLEYVFNDPFFGIICPVGIDKLLGMVSNFPESKAAGFSGISNEF
ncbi:hypothetical protein G9A89_003873 [Geosiphon pyriformis]|nr:hypothetical protein G9A89_003873 [Geosiphon pyriformis]